MTFRPLTDMHTPIGDVLRSAGTDGVLLEDEASARYAILPLDDDVLDFLLEWNPKFRDDCQRIRERMRAGEFHRHDDVRRMLHEA